MLRIVLFIALFSYAYAQVQIVGMHTYDTCSSSEKIKANRDTTYEPISSKKITMEECYNTIPENQWGNKVLIFDIYDSTTYPAGCIYYGSGSEYFTRVVYNVKSNSPKSCGGSYTCLEECEVIGCRFVDYLEYDSSNNVQDVSMCLTQKKAGCTDANYAEYDPTANVHRHSDCVTLSTANTGIDATDCFALRDAYHAQSCCLAHDGR